MNILQRLYACRHRIRLTLSTKCDCFFFFRKDAKFDLQKNNVISVVRNQMINITELL